MIKMGLIWPSISWRFTQLIGDNSKIESKVKSTKKVKDTKPSNTTKKIQNIFNPLQKKKVKIAIQ